MKVYLAGPYAARAKLAEYAAELSGVGYRNVTSWLKETAEIGSGTVGAATDLPDDEVAGYARTDLVDIEKADVVVAFTGSAVAEHAAGGSLHTGGRHVETGYALAKGKTVVIVGEAENVFHRMPEVTRVDGWHEAVVWLAGHLVGWTLSGGVTE